MKINLENETNLELLLLDNLIASGLHTHDTATCGCLPCRVRAEVLSVASHRGPDYGKELSAVENYLENGGKGRFGGFKDE